MPLTGIDAFLQLLADFGVEHIFGNPGTTELPLNDALDLCWQTLAECFEPQELLMKDALVQKYFPRNGG